MGHWHVQPGVYKLRYLMHRHSARQLHRTDDIFQVHLYMGQGLERVTSLPSQRPRRRRNIHK
jgi:hypothetical protein